MPLCLRFVCVNIGTVPGSFPLEPHTHTHALTLSHTPTLTYTHTHSHALALTHTHTHARTHSLTRTHSHAHTHTHILTTPPTTNSFQIMGRSEDDCKFEAGKFFLTGIMESGYGHSLRTLGNDFFTLLSNLDSLHESFVPSFPKMRAPSIRPVRNDDGSMTVHYYSSNSGLGTFMMGALQSCALQLFDLDIDIHHRVKKGAGHSHDEYHVFMDAKYDTTNKSSQCVRVCVCVCVCV